MIYMYGIKKIRTIFDRIPTRYNQPCDISEQAPNCPRTDKVPLWYWVGHTCIEATETPSERAS